jgi:transcriptional regulator with XRE-family HTH domain
MQPLGAEIKIYRQRMRVTAAQVAAVLSISVDELNRIENDNLPLGQELLPRWSAFTTGRGHRYTAPMKDSPLPGPRRKCEKCGFDLLTRKKSLYSKRVGQQICRMACRTRGCSLYDVPISFSLADGRRLDLSRVNRPFESPLCAECGRPQITHKVGSEYRTYCDDSACGQHNKIHWLNEAGQEFTKPQGRQIPDSQLPFQRRTCAKCGQKMSVWRLFHERSGKQLWQEACRRGKGCPHNLISYDEQGNLVDLKVFHSWARKYFLPPCPNCQKDSVRVISPRSPKNRAEFYTQCGICRHGFAWNPDKPSELQPLARHSRRNTRTPGKQVLRTQLPARSKGGRKKKTADQKWYFRIGQMFEGELPRCRSGRIILSGLQKRHAMAHQEWKKGLIKAGYSDTEVSALLAAKTDVGAAQLCVALTLQVEVKSVRVACSKFRKLNHTPSPAPHKD